MSIIRAKSAVIDGFDYRSRQARTRLLGEWEDDAEKLEASGGYVIRIGGDKTAFDSHGRMQFEYYDQTE